MNSNNTQLTPIKDFDPKNMIFSDPVDAGIQGSYRVNISYKYPDGTMGPLIFLTGKLFSFGVSENRSQETNEVTGWSFPLCLYSREGATEDEKMWVTVFNIAVERCVDHLIDAQADLGKEYTRAELTKAKGGLNPLYWKREKVTDPTSGKSIMQVVPGSGPTLYPKLIYSKKNQKFLSRFYDEETDKLCEDPRTLIGKYCYATAGVKVESIFVGKTPSLQIKIYESLYKLAQTGQTRLLHAPRQKANSSVLEYKQSGDVKVNPLEDGEGSIGSDNEDNQSETEPITKPVSKPAAPVRKTTKVIPKTKAKITKS